MSFWSVLCTSVLRDVLWTHLGINNFINVYGCAHKCTTNKIFELTYQRPAHHALADTLPGCSRRYRLQKIIKTNAPYAYMLKHFYPEGTACLAFNYSPLYHLFHTIFSVSNNKSNLFSSQKAAAHPHTRSSPKAVTSGGLSALNSAAFIMPKHRHLLPNTSSNNAFIPCHIYVLFL